MRRADADARREAAAEATLQGSFYEKLMEMKRIVIKNKDS